MTGKAGGLKGRGDFGEMLTQHRLEKRAFIGEVLVERTDGYTRTMCDEGGGELLLTDGGQNLKAGFENGVDGNDGARLDRVFTLLFDPWNKCRQMRTPNLKVPSSNRSDAARRQKEQKWQSWQGSLHFRVQS